MTSPPPSFILVLGAGELGTAVLESLTTHPSLANTKTKISLLLRPSTIASTNPVKQSELQSYREASISLIPGDISNDSISQLTSIFAPYDTIISCTGMTFPPSTQLKITHAVLAANVRRYFPWQFGLDYDAIGHASAQDLFDEQLDVRALLRAQEATKWVIVSTGMFISFLFEAAFGVVGLPSGGGDGTVVALGSWENELTVTDVQDIGRVVAELVLVEGGVEGVVFVAGDTVSMERLADVVDGVTGRRVGRIVKSVEQLREELAEEPDDVMRKYRAVFANGVGVSWDLKESFNAKHGMKTLRVEDWARRNLKA